MNLEKYKVKTMYNDKEDFHMGSGGSGGGEDGKSGSSGLLLLIMLFIVFIIIGASYSVLSF
ncbi:sporulation protein YjcZ [Bacillus mycoides]|uniref:sporulation protein YjcZ n=1 Tax=Bacillus mycoides TaxID=1405 RepID=UPI003F4E2BD6